MTYLTRRQWGEEGPETSFETLAVSPASHLYTRSGRRRIWPPIRFGLGVFWHLLRHGRRYDAVHTASFPYFQVIGARLALWLSRSPAPLIVDWHEVWGRDYWRSYLGPIAGRIGFAVERLCLRLPFRSFTFSRLAEDRLREYGHRAPILRLTGEYAGDDWAESRSRQEAAVVPDPAAGRLGRAAHPREARARGAGRDRRRPRAGAGLRGLILGDGPDFEATRERVGSSGSRARSSSPGG